ncbi:MAG: dihydrodipicolinate synthase family protein [Bacteroidales bacterium]|nr:dihydrodipicolinate synthase family protein [Bacteroidales bacterium]
MKSLTSDSLKGNWATLLLTTDEAGKLDYGRLEDEVETLVAAHPSGIYSNGTACEFYSQTMDEFRRISEILASRCEAAGVPFQIGVSHPCAGESLERLLAIRDLRPGAVQVILPDWFPSSTAAAVDFLKVMEENAGGIPMVIYNPPHAKRVMKPAEWAVLKSEVDSVIGLKVFDDNRSGEWYAQMREAKKCGLSIFIPGHHLAFGILHGADGAYSNVSCINPRAAQQWYETIGKDPEAAMETEGRIQKFMSECIDPFIVRDGYPNHACDRFMALVGGWADVGPKLRWPYQSIPLSCAEAVRARARQIIPEFFI